MKQLHEENERRANWATDALATFCADGFCGRSVEATIADEGATPIYDLISNLLHVAVRHELDPEDIMRRAQEQFDHENAPDYCGA